MKSNIDRRNKGVQLRNELRQPELFETGSDSNHPTGNAVMYCDGACSGNPGKSGIGVVINLAEEDAVRMGKNKEYRISEYIGIATNNIAEYSAFIKGLETAKSIGIRKIKVFLDSELLVKQMNGIYKVKNNKLIPLFNRARDILKAFESYTITHVRREINKEADSLARQAVSKKT